MITDTTEPKTGILRLHRLIRAQDHVIANLVDLARNVAAFDDHFLAAMDINVLRATLLEFREQARAAIAKAEGTS